ncbi:MULTISPECIES: hypothetical protein [Stenotrophomonas]|uniref:hypothetical protein n=1 Tax=Stenotrophomonas TaxID=40323 RepID=UPI0015F7F826|nr:MULTISPECIES: hypothetical protein [Stenotrophomonas]EKU9974442.1 hypothetical protein [Stenotrophomonas maltophilia]MBH1680307.1 hypothetical protein [Stenotrophomonas maltophilia]MBH1872660.1 hypothetical protein [Stenotrophomonas maltophilia]
MWIGSRAQRDLAVSCVGSAEGIKGGTHDSWMAGMAQRCIRYAWMVKQNRAFAYQHVRVKNVSFKPEFFI